jgi:hypothetical protein
MIHLHKRIKMHGLKRKSEVRFLIKNIHFSDYKYLWLWLYEKSLLQRKPDGSTRVNLDELADHGHIRSLKFAPLAAIAAIAAMRLAAETTFIAFQQAKSSNPGTQMTRRLYNEARHSFVTYLERTAAVAPAILASQTISDQNFSIDEAMKMAALEGASFLLQTYDADRKKWIVKMIGTAGMGIARKLEVSHATSKMSGRK